MKLGIVGSSYSVGSHKDSDTNVVLAKPFESWFGDIDLINSACASKGTELYLNKVLYLKKQHNIDTLLMEVINNIKVENLDLLNPSLWK